MFAMPNHFKMFFFSNTSFNIIHRERVINPFNFLLNCGVIWHTVDFSFYMPNPKNNAASSHADAAATVTPESGNNNPINQINETIDVFASINGWVDKAEFDKILWTMLDYSICSELSDCDSTFRCNAMTLYSMLKELSVFIFDKNAANSSYQITKI